MSVQSLGQEDPLKKGMETLSNILAWRIPWTKESSGLQSMGLQRVKHNLETKQYGEALYSQQKQDQELTVAQTMNSLLPNSD